MKKWKPTDKQSISVKRVYIKTKRYMKYNGGNEPSGQALLQKHWKHYDSNRKKKESSLLDIKKTKHI